VAQGVAFFIHKTEKQVMTLSVAHIQPIVALIAGVLILIAPWLLNYIVAFYLILVGVVGLGLLH
jgi:flagellar biosynthesis protein FliQ